jgi:hypothetical protein
MIILSLLCIASSKLRRTATIQKSIFPANLQASKVKGKRKEVVLSIEQVMVMITEGESGRALGETLTRTCPRTTTRHSETLRKVQLRAPVLSQVRRNPSLTFRPPPSSHLQFTTGCARLRDDRQPKL